MYQFVIKWIDEINDSTITDYYSVDITGQRGPNLIADSEVELLRRDTVCKKRSQEIFIYTTHFLIRNNKLPEDWDTLVNTNMYPNLYGVTRCPTEMAKEILKISKNVWKKSPEFLIKECVEIAKRYDLEWIDLP